MKVKVIAQYHDDGLEKLINKFIDELYASGGEVIDIKFSTVWSNDENMEVLTSALIMYKEDSNA